MQVAVGGRFCCAGGGAILRGMIREKLKAMGLEVPKLAGPFGAYVPAKRSGNLVFVAGQLPMKQGKLTASGSVPSMCSIEDAKAAAKVCVINALAAVETLGLVDQIVGVVRVGVFVASDASFYQQPQVGNGASEFLIELLGEAGKHARAAVGVPSLPLGAAVEIEFVFEVRE
jgi:enamine deaminase RidA (YjgF/YER057c/UK114 family)